MERNDMDSMSYCSTEIIDKQEKSDCIRIRHRRLISRTQNYEFDEYPDWHSKERGYPIPERVDTEAYIDYIQSYLSWYRSLDESMLDKIHKANIFDEFQDEFVHKMCTEEGEGEESRQKSVAIRSRDPELMNDPKERITFNMYRALELSKNSTTGARKDDFHVTVELLDEWHRILLEDVPAAQPGIRRSSQSDRVGAFGHWYLNGDELEPALNRFIREFCEMMPMDDDSPISSNKIANVVKWAAWALLSLLSIHPYFDGNGRLCRLLCNYALSAIFPFDIPIYNVYNDFTSRSDYVRALVIGRDCRCNDGDDDTECLSAEETFDKANPGLLATMILESCVFTCRQFHKVVEERLGEKLPPFLIPSPILEVTDEPTVRPSVGMWLSSFR